jgi:citrate lyase subunit beta / citryl-CoA lyase
VIGDARSWLYVPAHRPELLAKAMAGPADAVVYDLEDAVPADAKQTARRNALAAVRTEQPKPLWVRINDPAGPWSAADIDALAGSGVAGVRVPKCAHPGQAAEIAGKIGSPVHLLIESAEGVENAFELARCHHLVAVVSLGEADLLADLRARDSGALDWARQRVVIANRAAGLPSPPHAVWTALAEFDEFVADTKRARDRGFFGRSVIHPRQIEPVNQVFTPGHDEVATARKLLGSLREQAANGVAAWVDKRGQFIDPAVVASARWVIERAEHAAATRPQRG